MEITEGTRVRTREGIEVRRFAVNFPGWSDPNFCDFLLPTPARLTGIVTRVEQHGINPWTRYSIRFDDGTRISGLAPAYLEVM